MRGRGGGVCRVGGAQGLELIYLRSPPHPLPILPLRSFPYIEMRPQSLNFPGAVVRAGEGAQCDHRRSDAMRAPLRLFFHAPYKS